MILRPRQKIFVEKCHEALDKFGAALGVAPTGAGKTVMLSAAATRYNRTLILQHRDELVAQNRKTFTAVNPKSRTDLFTADRKNWGVNATFGMVQTLVKERNLATMPQDLDLLVVDECHHVCSVSYTRIIEEFRNRNPEGHILGLTATPQRSDRKALIGTFPVVADIIQLAELVQGGFLVRPRGIVMDLGLKSELDRIPKTSDFDMDQVAEVMDKSPLNDRIVKEWKTQAGTRRTVVFTATVAHAEHLCESFVEAGIKAVVVHGEMGGAERVATLKAFDEGRYQVILNVAVLTEGWDCQPVSCVVLVRPCSSKSVMLQMVGRGLRKLDPERYPGQTKSDCVIMDFGYSLVTHGNLEADVRLIQKAKDPEPGDAPEKTCKGCGIKLPISVMLCPICGYEDKISRGILEEFRMTEVELIDASPFQWESLFDDLVLVANGMQAWAAVISFGGCFWAVGAVEGQRVQKLVGSDERMMAISSADDFLRSNGDTSLCRKTRSWLNLPPTQKQLQLLGSSASMFNMNRYRASCLLTWNFNENKIRSKITTKC
jgi:superfamily II DNA or RNA helicase